MVESPRNASQLARGLRDVTSDISDESRLRLARNLKDVTSDISDESKPRLVRTLFRSRPFQQTMTLSAKKNEVNLANLFHQRRLQNGEDRRPRRILIRGKAGVGKTTLCKRIVYDFLKSDLGKECYDRILWIPLRDLKQPDRLNSGSYDFSKLFKHQYFFKCDPNQRQEYVEALTDAVSEDQKHTTTLFLLDGLDEVSQLLNEPSDSAMKKFLKQLLERADVIITSRPYTELKDHVQGFDLELETKGFSEDQISQYIDNALRITNDSSMSSTATRMKSLLKSNRLVNDLVSIPILLDAVCYLWKENTNDDTTEHFEATTMTSIYRAIELNLWKKDIVKLNKQEGGKTINAAHLSDLQDNDLDIYVEEERKALEFLAFTGMKNNQIEFGLSELSLAQLQLARKAPRVTFGKTLSELSFLRSSEITTDISAKRFYFIHLTIQEYFAARFFATQVKTSLMSDSLLSLGSDAERPNNEHLTVLQSHKYDDPSLLWRFSAGILSSDDRSLCHFFEQIEQQPRDILGPSHQRLLASCLHETREVNGDEFDQIRSRIQQTLYQWFALALQSSDRSIDILLEFDFSSDNWREVFDQVWNSPQLTTFLSNATRFQFTSPSGTLEKITSIVTDVSNKAQLRQAALRALGSRIRLPQGTIDYIVDRLKDKNDGVYQAAIDVLRNQTALSEPTLLRIASSLQDGQHHSISSGLVPIFLRHPKLPESVLDHITKLIRDRNLEVRLGAIQALAGQAKISQSVLDDLVDYLTNKDEALYLAAAATLSRQPELPDQTLNRLVELLQDKEELARFASMKALETQSRLPGEAHDYLIKDLTTGTGKVREAAAATLANYGQLPDKLLDKIAGDLKTDRDNTHKDLLLKVLCKHTVSEKVIDKVCGFLWDPDPRLCQRAARVLQKQITLPKRILDKIHFVLSKRNEHNRDVLEAVLYSLRGRTDLDEPLRRNVALCLDLDQIRDINIRLEACVVLQSQSTMLPAELEKVAKCLDNKYNHDPLRREASALLEKHPALSRDALNVIGSCLHHSEIRWRQTAVRLLLRQRLLPEEIVPGKSVEFIRALLTIAIQDQISLISEGDDSYVLSCNGKTSLQGSGQAIRQAVHVVHRLYLQLHCSPDCVPIQQIGAAASGHQIRDMDPTSKQNSRFGLLDSERGRSRILFDSSRDNGVESSVQYRGRSATSFPLFQISDKESLPAPRGQSATPFLFGADRGTNLLHPSRAPHAVPRAPFQSDNSLSTPVREAGKTSRTYSNRRKRSSSSFLGQASNLCAPHSSGTSLLSLPLVSNARIHPPASPSSQEGSVVPPLDRHSSPLAGHSHPPGHCSSPLDSHSSPPSSRQASSLSSSSAGNQENYRSSTPSSVESDQVSVPLFSQGSPSPSLGGSHEDRPRLPTRSRVYSDRSLPSGISGDHVEALAVDHAGQPSGQQTATLVAEHVREPSRDQIAGEVGSDGKEEAMRHPHPSAAVNLTISSSSPGSNTLVAALTPTRNARSNEDTDDAQQDPTPRARVQDDAQEESSDEQDDSQEESNDEQDEVIDDPNSLQMIAIINHKDRRGGASRRWTRSYLIKWADDIASTWEDEDNMGEYAAQVRAYESTL